MMSIFSCKRGCFSLLLSVYCLLSEASASVGGLSPYLTITPSPDFLLTEPKMGWTHLEIAIKLNFWYK
jgi:hypothetical protein